MRTFGFRTAIVASALVGLSTISSQAAEKIPGPYLGISGMVSMISDVDFTNGRANTTVNDTADLGTGFGVLLRGGYDYGNNIRVDLELGYRKADIDSVKNGTNGDGDANLFTGMLNASYDIDTDSKITPYISGGAGVVVAEGNIAYDTNGGSTGREDKNFYGVAPGAQLGVGISYALDKNVALTGGYSLLGVFVDKSAVDDTIIIHNAQLGLNYKF